MPTADRGLKIVSGGQTGVDRGALDAALARATPCAGWCPAGRKAEDGPIDTRYPLRELPGGGYRDRTERNVIDSDATLILHFGTVDGGTALTAEFCSALGRPCLLIDCGAQPLDDAVDVIVGFVREHDTRVLNVAGPRASKAPGAEQAARELIGGLLDRL